MASRKALKYRDEVARVMAQVAHTTDPHARKVLLEIAQQYDKLAEWAERQERPGA